MCTAFNIFAVFGCLFLGAHFVIGAFIYFPDFMLSCLGPSPAHNAQMPRCESLHWADPGYYKVEGGLSRRQKRIFEKTNQTGGIFLDDACYDPLCGLAMVPQTSEETTGLMIPMDGRNITALDQLPSSCRGAVGAGVVPVGAANGECGAVCSQIIGSNLRSVVAPVCIVSAGGSELGEVYGLCAKVAASALFGGVPVLLSFLAGVLVFLLAWGLDFHKEVGYRRLANDSDSSVPQAGSAGVPMRTKHLQGLLMFAAGAVAEPSFAVAGLVSYCQAGHLFGAFGILAVAAGIADPFQARAARTMRDSWRRGSATRELSAHVVTAGKAGGAAAVTLAMLSVLVTPPAQLGWSTAILRFLTIACSCGLSMPSAVVAELALEAHDLGLLNLDDDPNLGHFARHVGPAKYSLSLVALVAGTSLAAASDVGGPLRLVLLIPLFVLVAIAIPQVGGTPVTARHWLSCPYSIVAFPFPCILPILLRSGISSHLFEAHFAEWPCTVLQALLLLTGMSAAVACPCLCLFPGEELKRLGSVTGKSSCRL